ncbi:MAG: Gmad2 immunoglobulin-like domain-containing protein, partial [bacterium]|nr:Gmad2 immunoglobulin-like domain-containing protein [bacterium]
IKSPVLVTGQARGYWFFEASFPVKVFDSAGKELGAGVAQALSEWMTEDFVPFQTTVQFAKPTTQSGFLILEKDNPSGLPEHDDQLQIPVRF